jgi:hypothetical protein
MFRLLAALVAMAAASPFAAARAEEPARAILVIAPAVPRAAAEEITRDAATRGLDVASPGPQPEPASEALLAEIRPLYQNMKFAAAVKQLEAARDSLIADRVPSPGLLKALADVELWLGACALLARDKPAALDHWALAQRLAPDARPDRIFPPEVHTAFAAKRPAGKPVAIAVRLAPVDARLWIDGRRAGATVSTLPGLHYVVVERADQVPAAQILRITRSAPEIAVSLQVAADPSDALRQVSRRIRTAPLTRDEGIGVSANLVRPLWVISDHDDKLTATRYSASDVNRPVDEVVAPSSTLLDEVCRLERCAPIAPPVLTTPNPPSVVTAPLAPTEPPTPRKPVWKRGWFWGVLGATVLVAAGAATGVALGLIAPRDYDIRVR